MPGELYNTGLDSRLPERLVDCAMPVRLAKRKNCRLVYPRRQVLENSLFGRPRTAKLVCVKTLEVGLQFCILPVVQSYS